MYFRCSNSVKLFPCLWARTHIALLTQTLFLYYCPHSDSLHQRWHSPGAHVCQALSLEPLDRFPSLFPIFQTKEGGERKSQALTKAIEVIVMAVKSCFPHSSSPDSGFRNVWGAGIHNGSVPLCWFSHYGGKIFLGNFSHWTGNCKCCLSSCPGGILVNASRSLISMMCLVCQFYPLISDLESDKTAQRQKSIASGRHDQMGPDRPAPAKSRETTGSCFSCFRHHASLLFWQLRVKLFIIICAWSWRFLKEIAQLKTVPTSNRTYSICTWCKFTFLRCMPTRTGSFIHLFI